jgi:hypothetical protein
MVNRNDQSCVLNRSSHTHEVGQTDAAPVMLGEQPVRVSERVNTTPDRMQQSLVCISTR